MTNARKSRDSARLKVEQIRREQQAQARTRRLWMIAVAALLVAVIAGVVTVIVINVNNQHKIEAKATEGLSAVQTFTEERNHVTTNVTYPQTPPAGGNHDPQWLNCGIYAEPVRNENAVHDLEHGAVWITYKPDLPQADIEKLTKYATGQTYLVLSPYPGLPAPVVATAWGKQLKLTGVNDARLQAFVKKYKQGEQTPEPGSPCTGGIGTPTG